MGAISAIILAAGRGTRLAKPLPKAYLPLRGKPIITYSLEAFSTCELISELVVVIHPDDRELFKRAVLNCANPLTVVHGGVQRQDSALAGVRAAQGEYVLVHDAARPCVSSDLIKRVISTVTSCGSAVPVIPITDSVKRVFEDSIIADINRSELFCAQTPQGFQRKLLLDALERACAQGRYFTDEAGVVSALSGVRPRVIPGEMRNLKITTEADLELAECVLTAQAAS